MNNFCTNCGAKIRKEDNFCTHCGTKIDKSGMTQNNHLNSASDTIEKKKAKKELKRGMETMRTSGELKFNPIKF